MTPEELPEFLGALGPPPAACVPRHNVPHLLYSNSHTQHHPGYQGQPLNQQELEELQDVRPANFRVGRLAASPPTLPLTTATKEGSH